MPGQRDQAGEILTFWLGETRTRQIWRDTAMAFAGVGEWW